MVDLQKDLEESFMPDEESPTQKIERVVGLALKLKPEKGFLILPKVAAPIAESYLEGRNCVINTTYQGENACITYNLREGEI